MKYLGQSSIFGRQCPLAYARRVRLHYSDHAIHPMRWHAGARACAARGRIRRGDVRICAVIDVEKCALRAFKEDSFAALKGAMKINHRVADKRAQLFPGGEITFVYLAKIDRLCPERLEDAVVLENFGLQLFREKNRLHQVGHAQPGAGGLVAVGRTDPAFRCPDFRVALAQLALLIEQPVIRQDQVSAIADEQVLADGDSQFAQTFDFCDQRDWIDNDAVADHANFSAPEYSRWDQMQNVLRTAMDDGVAGIVPALTAHDDVGLGCEHVDDFPLPFIAPLRTD